MPASIRPAPRALCSSLAKAKPVPRRAERGGTPRLCAGSAELLFVHRASPASANMPTSHPGLARVSSATLATLASRAPASTPPGLEPPRLNPPPRPASRTSSPFSSRKCRMVAMIGFSLNTPATAGAPSGPRSSPGSEPAPSDGLVRPIIRRVPAKTAASPRGQPEPAHHERDSTFPAVCPIYSLLQSQIDGPLALCGSRDPSFPAAAAQGVGIRRLPGHLAGLIEGMRT